MSDATLRRAFFCLAVAAVVAAVAGGLIVLGPPSQARQRRLDATRIDDLQRIARAVDLHRRQKGTLPESLDALQSVPEAYLGSLTDPVSGAPYSYRQRGKSEYEVCASFELESGEAEYPREVFWRHPAGVHCFVLDADRPRSF